MITLHYHITTHMTTHITTHTPLPHTQHTALPIGTNTTCRSPEQVLQKRESAKSDPLQKTPTIKTSPSKYLAENLSKNSNLRLCFVLIQSSAQEREGTIRTNTQGKEGKFRTKTKTSTIKMSWSKRVCHLFVVVLLDKTEGHLYTKTLTHKNFVFFFLFAFSVPICVYLRTYKKKRRSSLPECA